MKKMKAVVNALDKKSHINPEIYGHFSEHLGRCIYEGIYVGEDSPIPNTRGIRNDVIDAFKQIKMPVLRWPGGCFADTYHWKDGIGDKATRPEIVNIHWGGTTEDNSFGTHEFLDLCELVGCEPYIAGNLGSGTVQEMQEWVEYITSDGKSPMTDLRKKNGKEEPWKLKYFGIGNENWGCGGNMKPDFYGNLYMQFQSYCRDYSGNHLFKVACGPSGDDSNWTEGLLKVVNDYCCDALSLHYYTVPSGDFASKGDAKKFTDEEYYKTIANTQFIEKIIETQSGIIKRYSDKIKLIIDEWGCWYDVEEGTNPGFLYQQNTMRDAIVAAINLNIFNNHSDMVCMANLAQTVNVLQAVLLTEGEKLVKTPTFHVFDMFKTHQDAELIYSYVDNCEAGGNKAISQSASIDANGKITYTIANSSLDEDFEIECAVVGAEAKKFEAQILTSGDVHDYNDFENGDKVKPASYSVEETADGFKVVLPKCSVVSVVIG